jgi:hypothetical protein
MTSQTNFTLGNIAKNPLLNDSRNNSDKPSESEKNTSNIYSRLGLPEHIEHAEITGQPSLEQFFRHLQDKKLQQGSQRNWLFLTEKECNYSIIFDVVL